MYVCSGSQTRFFKAAPPIPEVSRKKEKQAAKAERTQMREAEKEERQRQRAAAERKAKRGERRKRVAHQAGFDANYDRYDMNHEFWANVDELDEMKSDYERLHQAREKVHADFRSNPFPRIRKSRCKLTDCMQGELLSCCHHDLKKTLRSSGQYSAAWLKKERVHWHPDKFSGKGDGPIMATEMFKMIQRLIEER